MPDVTILSPDTVHPTQHVGYGHVAQVGDMLYLAGQIALDRDQKLVGEGDIEAQTKQVYANLQAVLEAGGSDLAHIVKLTTYMTRREDLGGFRNVRNALWPQPFPPNTLVFISGLADPRYLIEIEALAVVK